MNGSNFEQVLQTAVQAMNMGQDPMPLLQQSLGGNPKAAQALQMMSGKNAHFLQNMAMNMARERGINVNTIIQRLGIHI